MQEEAEEEDGEGEVGGGMEALQGLPILILSGNLRINYKREYATRIYRLGCYTN